MTSPFPPVRMAGTRFRSRHVHKTVAEFLQEKLSQLGWIGSTINFGSTAVTFREIQPDESGLTVAANTVSVTAGDLSNEVEQQLGGGIYEVVIPFFIDVYGETPSISTSIAEDLREQLAYGRVLPLLDWSDVQNPLAVEGSYIEFENVTGPERPQASQVSNDFRRNWRVVKVEAHVFYAMNPTSLTAPSDGQQVLTGEGAPGQLAGEPGDEYVDLLTGDVYTKGI